MILKILKYSNIMHIIGNVLCPYLSNIISNDEKNRAV